MIRVDELSKEYGARKAVSKLSFQVEPGEIIGFLGPNGAGKSTTLRMLAGYLEPTSGTIRIDGIDALAQSIEARKRIGYMAEAAPLYGEMRTSEYLEYRAGLKGVARKGIRSAVDRAIEQASVTEAKDRIIGQLSKGTKQRVALADALVADPPILILDEPTAGLDPNQIRQVRDLVNGFRGKKTVIVSTHILPEVEASADRILILHRGSLVASGSRDDIRARMNAGARATLTLSVRGEGEAVLALIRETEGVSSAESLASDGEVVRVRATLGDAEACEGVIAALVRAGYGVREARSEEGSLEDVFAELTTAEVTP